MPRTRTWAASLYLVLAFVGLSATHAHAQPSEAPRRVRYRARQEVLLRWAPRYQLDATVDPLGLEQRVWRRVDMLPLYHRASLDVADLMDGRLAMHFAGWGALDLTADSAGGVAAGDVAIGFVELALEPVRLWAGRRFLTFGPPGGLHVDGGGASVRTEFGLVAEAFVGRPVTPTRTSLLGPEPSFTDATVAYGARLAYADAGSGAGALAMSVGYAELWGRGLLGSRTVDVSGYWYPNELRIEVGAKVDVQNLGMAQARIAASVVAERHVTLDVDYLHLEPGRWIPSWSIFSVFETSPYDELSAGATWRPVRALALRGEVAGRMFSRPTQHSDATFGYRADFTARVVPSPEPGVRLRAFLSRRDDGVVGYTLFTAGAAFDPWPAWVIALDGAFGIDDQARRDSLLGRASIEFTPAEAWKVGATLSVARTPIAAAEARAMLRASWSPEGP